MKLSQASLGPGLPEHFVAEAVFLYNIFNAIDFAVRRRSDLGRRRGVVVHSLDDHSQKDRGSSDHKQSPWRGVVGAVFPYSTLDQNSSLQLAFLRGIGRTWADGGAWLSTA